MKTLFDTDEEEEVESKASEITLSTASLLGIFFGLVLICGVFFGFGYSLGRGMGSGSQAKVSETQPAGAEDTTAVTNSPAPALAPDPVAAPVTTAQLDSPQSDSAQVSHLPTVKAETANQGIAKPETAEEDAPAKPVTPVSSKPSPGKEAPAYTPQVDTPSSYGGKPVVQIAAVTRPQDAYTLVSALRKHGYGAVIHSDPQDKLLHVQVGPFADRTQASAMQQKLLSDGYNAIIKQ